MRQTALVTLHGIKQDPTSSLLQTSPTTIKTYPNNHSKQFQDLLVLNGTWRSSGGPTVGLSLLGNRTFHRVRDTSRKALIPPAWVVSLAVIFAAWESISLLGLVSANVLPPLHDVLIALVQLGGTPTFLERVGQSFLNVTAGILLAVTFVMPLALLVGSRRQLDEAITPIIMLIGALPDLAILTLLVSFVGRGN